MSDYAKKVSRQAKFGFRKNREAKICLNCAHLRRESSMSWGEPDSIGRSILQVHHFEEWDTIDRYERTNDFYSFLIEEN